VRETLSRLRTLLPDLKCHEVPSGSKAFDWTVPNEWNVREAYVVTPDGRRILDFAESNLHLLGYSTPVDAEMPLAVLQDHLYSDAEQPDAIPYVTSYYEERWGFCLKHSDRIALKEGTYRVVIDATLEPGSLTFGDLVIRGESEEEVLLSTYVCHPSLANNELSGPVVATYLARWVAEKPRRYTYRFVFVPETIGSIVYLSQNLDHLKRHVVAGFNLTCIGDDRSYSYLPTRDGDTLSDRVALHTLGHLHPDFVRYSYLDRGSDERQYNSPGVDLPVALVIRTKFGAYPEYHTSLDDLSLVTPDGLFGGYDAVRHCLLCLEQNLSVKATVLCEPQMGKRGLYNTLSRKGGHETRKRMMDVLAYADGRDVLDLAETLGCPAWELEEPIDTLRAAGLLEVSGANSERGIQA